MIYVYVNESDEDDVVEIQCPASKFKRRRRINGQWYAVSTALQHKPAKPRNVGIYPYYSTAMGIHPSQIPECQQVYAEAGLGPQEFDKWGDVKITSRAHRKRLMKARGFVDRNSYTGY